MLTSCIIQPHNKETALEPMTFFSWWKYRRYERMGSAIWFKRSFIFFKLVIHSFAIYFIFLEQIYILFKCFWHFVQQHIYFHHAVSYLVLLCTIFHPAPPTFWMKIKLIDFSLTKCHAKLFICHFFFMNMKKKKKNKHAHIDLSYRYIFTIWNDDFLLIKPNFTFDTYKVLIFFNTTAF